MISKNTKIVVALASILMLSSIASAAPITSTWNVDSNGDWNVAGNWTSNPSIPGDTIRENNDIAVFSSVITAPTTVTAVSPTSDAYFTLNGMTFNNANSYTIAPSGVAGNFINLNGNGTTANVTDQNGSHTIGVDLSVYNTPVLNVNVANAADTLTISGNIVNTYPYGSTPLAGNVVKAGAGTLLLSGDNNFDGGLTVTAGTVVAAHANAFGGSTGAVALTGTADLGATATVNVGALTGAGSVTNNGAAASTLNVNIASGSTQFDGVISNGVSTSSLSKVGAGMLVLTSPQTYTGATKVIDGTLKLQGIPTPSIPQLSDYITRTPFMQIDATNASSITTPGGVLTVADAAGSAKSLSGGGTPALVSGAGAINDLSSFHFDGSSWLYSTTPYANHVNTNLDIFIVANSAATQPHASGPAGIMSMVNSDPAAGAASNNDFYGTLGPSYGSFVVLADKGSGNLLTSYFLPKDLNGVYTAGTPYIANDAILTDGRFDVYINGVNKASNSYGPVPNKGNDSFILGTRYQTNTGGTPGFPNPNYGWVGDIGEVLIFDGSLLSAEDRAAVNDYLNAKWKTPIIGGGGGGSENMLSTSTDLDISATGILDLNGVNQAVGSLSGAVGSQVLLGTGNLTVGSNNIATSFDGVIDGSGMLTKNGSAALVLNGANLYTGATTINEGKLTVNGSLASNLVSIVSGAILSGSGTLNSVDVSGIISPGNSTGTLTTGSEVWNGNGLYQWELSQVDGVLGTTAGWDWISMTGTSTLEITADAASPFVIDITGESIANWDASGNYSWVIATAEGGISGFAADKFSLDTSHFGMSFASNGFSLSQNGNDLVLSYVPEPGTIALLVTGLLFGGVWSLIRRQRKVS